MGTRFEILAGTVDLLEGVVHTATAPIPLTPNEVALIGALHDRSPEPCSPEELLTDALGYAASAKSRTVTVTMQRLRKKLEPDPAEPRTIVTVRGEGYALRYADTPIRPVRAVGLPPGRDLDAIDAGFAAGACPLVLVGPGGVGKTTLARSWAEREGADWVELFDVTDAGALRRRLVAGLDLERAADADAAIRDRLAGRPVVLDNAEDLDGEARATLAGWLSDASAAILVTSQTPLGLPRERRVVLGELDRDTARAVLRESRSRSGLAPLPASAEDQVLDQLGGMPLALVITAPLADFLDDLDEALDVPSVDTAPHHATLSAGVGRTFDNLAPEALATARAIAVFSGPASLHAIAQVADQPLPLALKSVAELRGCGLARADGPRIDLLPIARTLLRHDADAVRPARERLVAWLVSLDPSHEQLKPLRPEIENALPHARGLVRLELLARHVELLYAFGPVDDIPSETARWLEGVPLAPECEVHRARAMLLVGQREAARDLLEHVLDRVTDRPTFARGASLLATAQSWASMPEAVDWARRALAALDADTPLHVRVETGTYAGYALARADDPAGFDAMEDAIRAAGDRLPARALTAALSKARLRSAPPGELERARHLLERVGGVLGEVQRAIDTADLAVILLDAHQVEEAWEMLREPRRVLPTGHRMMLGTILTNAAIRLLDHPERTLELMDEVGPPIPEDLRRFVRLLAHRDRAGVAAMEERFRILGEAFLAGDPLPESTDLRETRKGLETVRRRGL